MLPMCVTKKTTSKFRITTTNPESDDGPSARRHKAVSSVRITVVTDKFSISSRSHLTKASHSSLTHFHTFLFLSLFFRTKFLSVLSLFFVFLDMNYQDHATTLSIVLRQKPVGALGVIVLSVLAGRNGG